VNVCINVNYDCYEFKECKEKEKCVCMYRPVTVCLHYLAVICIYMIYKCFELEQRSTARSGQAKLKTAKPSYRWEAVKRPVPRGG
jgi:hypothetical protein